MRIVVCVKHVPDVLSERRIEDGAIVRGEDDVLNELDENAIEAAVSVIEERGGQVIALTMGPQDAEDALRRALQMGADQGVLICDQTLEGTDAIGTAQILAAAIHIIEDNAGPVDLVLTGMASLDGMTSMMPGALAAALDWPCLTMASTLSVEEDEVTISKCADGFDDVLACGFPAVVSVTDQVNSPRFPNFKAMAAARNKPIECWDLEDLGLGTGSAQIEEVRVGFAGSGTALLRARQTPNRSAGNIITDTGQGGIELAQFLKEAVK